EGSALLPFASADIALVQRQTVCQGQQQHQCMLSYAVGAVSCDIAYRDAEPCCSIQVHVVHAGCSHADEFQLGQGFLHRGVNHHFIGDGNLRAAQAVDPVDIVCVGPGIEYTDRITNWSQVNIIVQ